MDAETPPRVAFITNMCPHYRVRTFEILSRHLPTKFFFFSDGGEWYWQQKHGVHLGDFEGEYLRGFNLGRTRVTPSLATKLWRGKFDVVIKCVNGKFALPVAYAVARLRRKPFILWTEMWADVETPLHRVLAPLTFYVYSHADAIVTSGDHGRRHLMGKGVPPDRIFPGPYAVDNAIYSRPVSREEIAEVRRKMGVAEDARVMLYLGRVEASKGLDVLLQAFARALSGELEDTSCRAKPGMGPDARGLPPSAVLVIAGEGRQKAGLQQMAADLGVSQRVRFVPYVPTAQTVPYYAASWAAVLPSVSTPETREPWGLTVNEAMNQGVPVIASTAVGAAAGGLVRDNVTGLVVPERDPRALAQALSRMFNEPGLRDRLGRAARVLVSQWDNERMVLGFRRAVAYVLGRGPGATSFSDELSLSASDGSLPRAALPVAGQPPVAE
jgi:glycosyltransferase involved in cell wall biosynthesis